MVKPIVIVVPNAPASRCILRNVCSRLSVCRAALAAGRGEHIAEVKSPTGHQRAGGEQRRLAHALGIFSSRCAERESQKARYPRNDHQEHDWQHSSHTHHGPTQQGAVSGPTP
jgi:hypothetical protein